MAGFNRFAAIAAGFDTVLKQIPRKTAFDIQAQAQNLAAVDTGFMKNSIYVVTASESTYGNAGTPPKDSYLLPETPAPGDDYTAYAAVGANYGAYVNYGTRFMAAQPFWEPAIDAVRPGFEAALAAIEDALS